MYKGEQCLLLEVKEGRGLLTDPRKEVKSLKDVLKTLLGLCQKK